MARRKLVLEGPAAAAVERLAEQAGISPAELIKRALSREDEAQRADPDLVGAALTPTGLSVTGSEVPLLDLRAQVAQLRQTLAQATAQQHGTEVSVAGAAGDEAPSGQVSSSPSELRDRLFFADLSPLSSDFPFLEDLRLVSRAVAVRRPGDASRPARLIVSGVFDGNRLTFEIPYPEPGDFGFPFSGGQVIVTVPPGDASPSVRFEADAETSVTRREPDRG